MTPAPAEVELGAVQAYGVYAPLAYVRPADPTMGGYTWLSPTDFVGGVPQTLHNGVDLNSLGGGDSDLGVAVVAAVDAVVRAVVPWDGWSTGYGNYVVLETDDPRATPHVWLKHCHLDTIDCSPGQRLRAGARVGGCGRSGNQGFAHLHWEVLWAPPPSWGTWPSGWSREQVERYWMRPADWFWATIAAAAAQQGAQGGGTDMAILTGAQQAAVQAAVWGDHWNPEAAEFAIPRSWREEWKAGRWRGAPVAAEQLIPASEENPGGSFQLFQQGCAAWLPDQEVSWNG